MPHAIRTIALLTDFGTRDPYVAVMKGVIASRTDAAIADLTHEIPAFDAFEAAWFLRTTAPWWPAGTIFVCVVDPGVGTSRRIVAAECGGRIYLAPDNGLLTFIECEKLFSVENESLFLPAGSSTFHGRDRFAPVAAALANGTAIEAVGPKIDPRSDVVRLDYAPPQYSHASAYGTIVSIDRFGNCVTDLEVARVSFSPVLLRIGTTMITRVERNYGDAESGPFVLVGSTGSIEISVKNASAAEVLHLRRGDRVEVIGS
jgi:S-adenosyl-L-methionine hydrolase (adenosine-forming)